MTDDQITVLREIAKARRFTASSLVLEALDALAAAREEGERLRESLAPCELLSASGNSITLDFGSRKEMEAAYDALEALTGDQPHE